MTTKHIENLVSDSLAIERESAIEAGTVGYMARAMVQATMPHKKTNDVQHVRTNGNFTLTMTDTVGGIGLPYGSIPRLMLAWIGSEVIKTKERKVVLGDSMSAFMRELELVPTGGRWGSIARLKDQSKRLASCTIRGSSPDGYNFNNGKSTDIGTADFWWDTKTPEQLGIFKSTLELSEGFYSEILNHPIPVDMRALKMLKRSPLALDVYSWLTYRIYTLNAGRRPSVLIPWKSLQMQFGAGYPMDTNQGLRDFKKQFIVQLKKVHILAYKDAKFDIDADGLTLHKSPLALPHRPRKIIA